MGFASGFTGSANNSQTQNTAIAVASSDLSTNTTTENLSDSSTNLGPNATNVGGNLSADTNNNTSVSTQIESEAGISLANQQSNIFGDATSLANNSGTREAATAAAAIDNARGVNQDAFAFGTSALSIVKGAQDSLTTQEQGQSDLVSKVTDALSTANQNIASLAGGRALLSDNSANSNTLLIAGGVVAFLVVAFLVARSNK